MASFSNLSPTDTRKLQEKAKVATLRLSRLRSLSKRKGH
jgi:hypothetical protein